MTVRVGHIRFLNCYPLYHGLMHRGTFSGGGWSNAEGGPAIAFVPGVPTDLNRMLVQGEIDLGPISSIAYARDYRKLVLSRYLSISSFGAVDSIQLVTKGPLEAVESVALTPQSATSVALLKTILKLRYRRHVRYVPLDVSPAEALQTYDAVLLIGDEGLEALHFPLPGTSCYDLGRLWQDWVGLPMVYAVWAAREEFAREYGQELRAVEEELVKCMDYGRERLPEVVAAAESFSRLSKQDLARYFSVLRYDFPSEYQEGLRRFYELAFAAGEVSEVPRLRFIDEVVDGTGAGAGD